LTLKPAAAFYDPLTWKEAMFREILDFEPDLFLGIFGSPGPTWAALDIQNRLWPGGPLPPEYEYQFIEGEYMKADEYDHFLADPSDFTVRCFLPRVYRVLGPLAQLPPISQLYDSFEHITNLFTHPEFQKMAEAVVQAGRKLEKHRSAMGDAYAELASLGFPDIGHGLGAGGAPFDTLSSFYRGMKGSMLDMYRQPEKLLKACDLIFQKRLDLAKPVDPGRSGAFKRTLLPLWRGDCSFMSDRQFEKFYWPGLNQAMLASIELGYIPIPIFEAKFGRRLEHLLEMPEGKVIAVVEHMDILPAREMLAGHTCIIGKPPVSLHYASIQETEEYYRDLLKNKKCGMGGGLMLRMVLPQKAGVEELKAMVRKIKEYCRY
jgi:hypothetical protein